MIQEGLMVFGFYLSQYIDPAEPVIFFPSIKQYFNSHWLFWLKE
jgi:hypothetical protein